MGWRFCQQIIRHEITGDGGTCGVPRQQTLVQQSLCRVRGRSAHEHARGRWVLYNVAEYPCHACAMQASHARHRAASLLTSVSFHQTSEELSAWRTA